ncbi:xylose isomerase-like protein [Aspergillus sclerotioniger CBS 115572]|uniref:Xylose isomerase-like protein n=1 Tax=Aspergillus sclerotioniger CBS 115572 TaxID=1450535 RepID=A0A317WB37_9EURO|nr:xylose isomerase-like protein [Aspergillus sclerotioniger CBS 115572]PWY83706.1 xylose isomerase-like protein [Aspergillus sclerotioniger CBS 115572]
MSISGIDQVPFSYATCSIGSPSSPLPEKLSALSNAGFTAVELAFPDILSYAASLNGHDVAPDNYPELVKVAKKIRQLCDTHNLKVMMLQPFANFEGWPRGSKEREDAFKRANGWSEIMTAVGTDLLQVGSTDAPNDKLTTSQEDIITDLRELADLLGTRNQRIAYENWCWSSHAPTWKQVWEIVRAVDRPNIGLCLDTFQTAGSEFGDPTTSSGHIEDSSLTTEQLTQQYNTSLDELARTIPADKIYLLQVSDAYKPLSPFKNKDIDSARPRARWSHSFRPMPYRGGYLPIEEMGRAVLKTGFRGWFSMEIFDGGKTGKEEPSEMEPYAKLAMASAKKFLENCAAA